jgi:hypothetical protein
LEVCRDSTKTLVAAGLFDFVRRLFNRSELDYCAGAAGGAWCLSASVGTKRRSCAHSAAEN